MSKVSIKGAVIGALIAMSGFSLSALCEEPQKVTVCQLLKDPPAYDHKLVEVEAIVSQGFEDFTLIDPHCNIYPEIWLEYGGKVNSGTIYLGPSSNDRSRPNDLVVQNVPIPLVEDDLFHKLDDRIHTQGLRGHGPLTHATLVGRYFAGRKETYPNGSSAWSGFGHFGCCTLLAIQQVKHVSLDDRKGLDAYSFPEPLIDGFKPNPAFWFSLLPADVSAFVLESEKKAEDGSRAWTFDDPRRVATELIERDLMGKTIDPSQLKEIDHRTGFFEYEFKLPQLNRKYSIGVDRPYWLSFYAQNPNRIAWVAQSATVERLNSRKAIIKSGEIQK